MGAGRDVGSMMGRSGEGGGERVAEVEGVQAGQHQIVRRLVARYSRSESPAQAPWTLWPPTPQRKGALLASPELTPQGQCSAAGVWRRGEVEGEGLELGEGGVVG